MCCFRGCSYYSFSWLCSITKFSKSCLLWPFYTNISTEKFSSSLICFSQHIECALWRKPLNTRFMVLGSMYDVGLIFMLVMAFLRCTLNSYLLLMVLLVIIISKKIKDLFLFSYYMVYWIAVSCLRRISWKAFAWYFAGKWAWFSCTHHLNVFDFMCIARSSAIALSSRCCKWLSDNSTVSDKPMWPAFSNNLILFS